MHAMRYHVEISVNKGLDFAQVLFNCSASQTVAMECRLWSSDWPTVIS